MAKVTKKRIVEHLEKYGQPEPLDIDIWVEKMLYAQDLMKKAEEDIDKRGIICNVSKSDENPYFQKNNSIGTYNEALKMIMQISKKLGLSAQDRKDLGWSEDSQRGDGF